MTIASADPPLAPPLLRELAKAARQAPSGAPPPWDRKVADQLCSRGLLTALHPPGLHLRSRALAYQLTDAGRRMLETIDPG